MDSEQCYQAALRLLNYRFRSEKELDERLRQKGFAPEEIQTVLARLKQENWINDRRFAQAFAQSRRQRHRGKHRIQRELRSLGVASDEASEVLNDSSAERESLRAICLKRIGAMGRLRGQAFATGPEGRRKLTSYLLRQGYDYSDVLAVIEEELGK